MKANEQQLTIEGDMKVTPESTEAPSQTLTLHGTSKMTANAVY